VPAADLAGGLTSGGGAAVAVAAPPQPPETGMTGLPGREPPRDEALGRLVFNRRERLSRLLLFVKPLFVLPLLLWISLYRAAAVVCAFLAFWAILFTGRYPPGLFGFVRGYVSSHYRIASYFPLLLSDEWSAGEQHPVRFEIEPPGQQSRLLLVFAKLPAMVLGVFYGIASAGTWLLTLVAIPMWFAILITGKYPTPVRNWALGVLQWSTRVTAWQFMMSDDWRMFGSSLKVRLPSIVAAYTLPAFMMWFTFWGPTLDLSSLFSVDEGMEVVDAFMIAGRDGDTPAARSLSDPRTISDQQLAALLQRDDLFRGYENASVDGWFRQTGTRGDTLQLQGTLRYSDGLEGQFLAFLIRRSGVWLIEGITIAPQN
jgi:hypothetical protein